MNYTEFQELCSKPPESLSLEEAFGIVCQLKELARWWLREGVLQKAREYGKRLFKGQVSFETWEPARRVPQESGCCWIPTVNCNPEQLALIRPAFVFPCRWLPGSQHDARSPKSLRRVADAVAEQLRKENAIPGDQHWRLVVWPEDLLAGLDLSEADWEFDSAWVPLAAGLLLARWEGRPKHAIWASGSWRPKAGISPVRGLLKKLQAAASFGVQEFFVPQQNVDELAGHQAARSVSIKALPADKQTLRDSLRAYLEALEIPPDEHDSPKRRAEYFLRINDDRRAREYYKQMIYSEVCSRGAEKVQQQTGQHRLTHLVTIVSKGYYLPELIAGVVGASHCLLLFNAEMAREAEQVEQRVPKMVKEVCGCLPKLERQEFSGSDREALLQDFREKIQDFLAGSSPENLVVDLTSGQRLMNLALYDAAPPGCWVMCCQTEMDRAVRRPVPFEEKFHLWRRSSAG